MYRKYIFIIISLRKNYSSRDTFPLKCRCFLNSFRLASLDQLALADEVQRRQQEIQEEERRIREEDENGDQVLHNYFSSTINGGLFGFSFNVCYSTLLHRPPLRFCRRMLGSNPGLSRLWHWQSDALSTWLDLIHNFLNFELPGFWAVFWFLL